MLKVPDVVHVAGAVNPVSDIETIEIELMLADIQTLENTLPKAERTAKSGDKDAKLRVEAIRKSMARLNTDEPLRKLTLDEQEQDAIGSFGLMTAKPILYVANVQEDDLDGAGPMVQQVCAAFASKVGASVVPVLHKLESEIAELDEPDRSEMLASSGLAEPALTVVARSLPGPGAPELLHGRGERGPRRGRSRSVRPLPQAAGVIHSDFEKGFIRAEVYSLPDLETFRSEKEIRLAGKLRTEGKNYIMQDGDICHFLFNT